MLIHGIGHEESITEADRGKGSDVSHGWFLSWSINVREGCWSGSEMAELGNRRGRRGVGSNGKVNRRWMQRRRRSR